jgi:hypothetical protein
VKTYRITLTGKTPLLMHADNIEWADRMDKWKNDPANRASSKAGDDRTPPFRWLGSLYHDEKRIVIPSDNIMRALMEGGAMVPAGSGKKTFKSQTQSGCAPGEMFWPFLVNKAEVPVEHLFERHEDRSFDEHQEMAAKHGFMLFLKRAKIGQSKHIRVRPRFDNWSTTGTIIVTDDQISSEVLKTIFTYAGQYKGLCDWRPGSKTPGSWGMFTVELKAA